MSDLTPTRQNTGASGIEAKSNLTRSQFLIWTGHQVTPDLPVYNMGWRFRLDAEVEPARFARAFEELINSTDSLRTTFTSDGDDIPRRVVGEAASGQHDTRDVTAEAYRNLIQELVCTPFDLSQETFRSALLRVADGAWEWVIVQHHIVTDAASGAILLERLAQHYAHPGDQAAFSFEDWAETTGSTKSQDHADFWQSKLPQMPSPPALYAFDATQGTARTTSIDVPLGPERIAKLRALAETDRFGALTPDQAQFNLLATALFSWLNRITGEDSLVLGVTTHGRTTMAAKETAGLFMEIFPLHANLAADMSLAEMHDHVAERAFELMMHASPGASSARGHAKFNIVLNYIRASFGDFGGAPVTAEWLEHGHFDPSHALWVDVMGFDGSALGLRLRLNAGLFPEHVKERSAAQILRAIDALLDGPDTALSAVSVADPRDHAVALTHDDPWATASVPEDICDAFAAQLQANPDQIAVTDDAISLTRAELDAQANAIARMLDAQGIQAGDRVGIFLTRSVHLVTSILAVMKLGAAYVPLDPLRPIDRLRSIAENADLKITLTESKLSGRWPDGYPQMRIEEAGAPQGAFAARNIDPASDAYVIFTSGSTGIPKGVRISRSALARYAGFAARTYAGGAPATWALHSAIGFDLTVTSIFAPLVSGGAIRAYPETLDTADLSILKVFEDDAVDIVKLTPAHLSLVTRQAAGAKRISTLILGGENLTTQLAGTASDMLGPDLALYNEYGPTEATVGCMVHRFDPSKDTGASVPIGHAADDTVIYVLDASLKPVPDEVVGEIFVAGPDRLATGYLKLDAETHAKFVPNPFKPGTLMYRTGDLAHVDTLGVIHYHGRNDDQIKVGSVRVELGEIRNAVMSHTGVADCVVTAGQAEVTDPQKCIACGLGSDHPDADIDDSGTCRLCRDYEDYREKAQAYFRTKDDLRALLKGARSGADYDCIMLLSGGKDSSYALGRLMELTPRVLAVTLDNGFISEGAMRNVSRVCEALGVDHRFISTPFMNEIFADSLERHANVCNGCFKTIYTLGMQLAQKEGIGVVVTGLSRGQLFETRLAPELFGAEGASAEQIDRNILEARRFYHRVPDTAAQKLNQGFFDDDEVFNRIQFVDFYRYCDVSVEEIYAYLDDKVPWLRPSDTGRSTNCLINDLGIYIHKKRRGYHNYALPYSWDVRTGHKTRNAALDELDDEIDEPRMKEIMQEIGYTPGQRDEKDDIGLACYIVAKDALDAGALRQHLARHLPRAMIPASIHQVPEIPLTANGKVDRAALENMGRTLRTTTPATPQAPANETEAILLDIWRTVLDREDVGPQDNFFDYGGDSVHAISIASRASRTGLAVTALDILTRQTISAVAGGIPATQASKARPPQKRATLDSKSMDRLGAMFGKKRDG